MFTSLFNWFAGPFFNALKTVWQAMWSVFNAGWFWLIGTVVGFVAITNTVSKFVYDEIYGLGGILGTLTFGGHNSLGSFASSLLGVINIFFPLQELFTLVSAYSLLFLAGTLYRFIKSWIPTVA